MNLPDLSILYEDNHLLAVNKPAALPTMGVSEEEDSVFRRAQRYLKEKYQKPGNVYVGIVSRLDAMVTGVLLLARTSKAAARLSQLFRERDVGKTYWAIIEQPLSPPQGTLKDFVRKNEQRHRMEIVPHYAPGAQEAVLKYRALQTVRGGGQLVEVMLLTGRKHQIRVQLTGHNSPVWGDVKYDAEKRFASGIALHSRALEIEHPVKHEPVKIIAPLPPAWNIFGIETV